MARMIPRQISDNTQSTAERRIFEKISSDLSEDWIALHSLELAESGKKPWTEVDFVLIGPAGVYCLEVKGGSLRREEGVWYQTGKGGEHKLNRGPFEQVIGPSSQLYKHLQNTLRRDIGRRLVVGFGMVTPDLLFNIPGPDVIEEVVYDHEDTASSFAEYIQRVSGYWINQRQAREVLERPLTPAERGAILHELRAAFDLRQTLPITLDKVRGEIFALTNEQYELLDYFDLNANPRMLVRGSAGSGKSMCAVDIAQAQAAQGKRALLVCFNKRLATYLLAVAEGSLGVEVTSFHDYMAGLILRAGLSESLGAPPLGDDGDSRHYYDVKFPEVCINALLELGDFEPYDIVIVDEGQDLIKDGFVEVIDFLLAGGIKDGSWAIFYDENQNIYGGLTDSAMNKLTEVRPFKFPLSVNCRNTRAIARATAVLSGLEPAPVMKVEGPEVEVIWYKDERHQRREISRVIGRWLSEGVSLPQITIISPKAFHRSGLAGGLESTIPYRLLDWNKDEPPPEDNISFSTIHSFKGLESDMVIMAYIDDAGDGGRP